MQRLEESAPAFVAELEGKKAVRYNAQTMLIPSAPMIRDALRAIPSGESRTDLQLRQDLAAQAGADVTCPRMTTISWLLVAEADVESRAAGQGQVAPWWRLTRDGKPYEKLPGGKERHRELLAAEGTRI